MTTTSTEGPRPTGFQSFVNYRKALTIYRPISRLTQESYWNVHPVGWWHRRWVGEYNHRCCSPRWILPGTILMRMDGSLFSIHTSRKEQMSFSSLSSIQRPWRYPSRSKNLVWCYSDKEESLDIFFQRGPEAQTLREQFHTTHWSCLQ